MSTVPSTVARNSQRRAFTKLVVNESRLAWRQPIGIIWGIGLPLLLLVTFGAIPATNKVSKALDGHGFFLVYVPVLVLLSIGLVLLIGVPSTLVSYREQGILRRLFTTPVLPLWLLAAQLLVNLGITLVALALLGIISRAAFGVPAPANAIGFVLAVGLTMVATFAIALWIAAVAHTAKAAAALGRALFYPLMFFAGLWLPLDSMPTGLRLISECTPLGAADAALQRASESGFPSGGSLAVLAAYAVVFSWFAVHFFKWE